MKVSELRTFIPSIDFEISKKFYIELGFEKTWEGTDLAIFKSGNYSFFLQKAYVKDWAENLMLQLYVEDLDSLYEVSKALVDTYENTKIRSIFNADYARTFHLIGPAGELWHMCEVNKK